jgi:DNA-binding transcriptional regulator GbsR (MarR family)
MNFTDNHIKIKSNWFDKNGLFSKVGEDAFLLYILMFKFYLHNQNDAVFGISIKMLKKESGFTMTRTYELFKLLIRYGIIDCNVTRWDRYQDNDFMLVTALDFPKTARSKSEKKGIEFDKPLTDEDQYVSVDMKMIQYYLDNNLSGAEIGLYCLIRKWSNNVEKQMWMSINEMADCLGLSNDKVHKMIKKLNRMYLMFSKYHKAGYQTIKGKRERKYRYIHHLFANYKELDDLRKHFKSDIDRNIEKWDKAKGKLKKEMFDNIDNDLLKEPQEMYKYLDEGFQEVDMTY